MRFYVDWDVKPYELKSINQFDRPAEVSMHNCCVAMPDPSEECQSIYTLTLTNGHFLSGRALCQLLRLS